MKQRKIQKQCSVYYARPARGDTQCCRLSLLGTTQTLQYPKQALDGPTVCVIRLQAQAVLTSPEQRGSSETVTKTKHLSWNLDSPLSCKILRTRCCVAAFSAQILSNQYRQWIVTWRRHYQIPNTTNNQKSQVSNILFFAQISARPHRCTAFGGAQCIMVVEPTALTIIPRGKPGKAKPTNFK